MATAGQENPVPHFTGAGQDETFDQYFQEELEYILSAISDQPVLGRQEVMDAVLEQADRLLDEYSATVAQEVVRWTAWFIRFNGARMSPVDRFWVQNTAYNIGTEHGAGLDVAKNVWTKVNGTDQLPWSEVKEQTQE